VICDLSIIALNGKYFKYVPFRAISLSRPQLTPSDKKLAECRLDANLLVSLRSVVRLGINVGSALP
ncbi:MAG: hypothetical protein J6U49_07370, partial [Alistipes sp.]|nr:hypothetical protein [Alistipes sp.]